MPSQWSIWYLLLLFRWHNAQLYISWIDWYVLFACLDNIKAWMLNTLLIQEVEVIAALWKILQSVSDWIRILHSRHADNWKRLLRIVIVSGVLKGSHCPKLVFISFAEIGKFSFDVDCFASVDFIIYCSPCFHVVILKWHFEAVDCWQRWTKMSGCRRQHATWCPPHYPMMCPSLLLPSD